MDGPEESVIDGMELSENESDASENENDRAEELLLDVVRIHSRQGNAAVWKHVLPCN